MKEMEYGNKKFEILDKGHYKGKDYVILNLKGYHPCAYVQSDINYYNNNDDDNSCPAHCGFTFYGTLTYWDEKVVLDKEDKKFLDRNFVGWDYAHLGDYTSVWHFEGDKKWTTKEILENVKEVIEWMIGKESK